MATVKTQKPARAKEQEPSAEEVLKIAKERFLEHDQAEINELKRALEQPLEHVEEDLAITDELKEIGAQPGVHSNNIDITETPTVVLPLSQSQVQFALHHKVVNSLRWLAVWCIRVAKLAHHHGSRVIFGDSSDKQPAANEK